MTINRNRRNRSSLVFLCAAIGWCPVAATAGSRAAARPENTGAARREVRASVSPGFIVRPLVRRLSGPIGSRLDFAFSIENLNRTRRLTVRPVAIRQQRNGLITIDDAAAAPDAVQLEAPGQFDVSNREEATLRGNIRVARDGGSMRFYGLLVTDLGRPVTVRRSPEGQPGAEPRNVQINYVTRYLLRVELKVPGASRADPGRMEITDAGLRSVDGRAVVQVVLKNTTSDHFAFRLRARLIGENGRLLGPPFFLSHPIRTDSPPPARYDCRILQGAEVVLIRQVPEPVLPGSYTLQLEVRSNARTVKEHSRQLEVKEGQFPAQEKVVARIVGDIHASPARIELSRRPRGNRLLPLKLTNRSDQSVAVKLRAYPRGESDGDLPWFTLRPTGFDIRPGGTRSVLVSASTKGAEKGHRYVFLEIRVDPAKTLVGGKRSIPIAFLGRGELDPAYEIGAFRWDPRGPYPSAVLPVRNTGDVHLALDAMMTIDNPFGGKAQVRGGFGRWVLPGDEGEIRFRFQQAPPAGDYPAVIELNVGHGRDPIRIDRTFVVE